MINAAMMIAPAPNMGNIKPGSKAGEGQGQLFGRAMAQQEQQVVSQTAEQESCDLKGLPGRGVLLSHFSALSGKDVSDLFALQPQQQELLEQLDMEMLDALALLLEQGAVPNSMDHAQLQQLVDLVEEVLPQWQFHNQLVVPGQDSELELLPEQQQLELEQKVEELIAWFSQYQEQAQQQEQTQQHPGRGLAGDVPPGQLVAAQQLEQVRERLAQLRTMLTEAGSNADLAKATSEAKGNQMAAATVRVGEMPVPQETSASVLEARFNDLLKPRQPQASMPQAGENGRLIQTAQQSQQAPVNQVPVQESGEEFFANILDKSAPKAPLAQAAMNTKSVADGILPLHNHLPGQPAAVTTGGQGMMGMTAPAAVAAPFIASQQVTDSQIFDQVVTHLSGSDKGDMGRMVLRLHPAELGSLRIELMVEGDRIRANLHAQTQQVQEVLERNLGQLRNSLAEQGLKIDHFQVSSDARQNHQQGQAEDLAHERHAADQSAQNRRVDREEPLPEDQAIPLAHVIRNGGRGISLHV